MQWEGGGEGIKPLTQAFGFTGFYEFLMDSGLLGAWKAYLEHVFSDVGSKMHFSGTYFQTLPGSFFPFFNRITSKRWVP